MPDSSRPGERFFSRRTPALQGENLLTRALRARTRPYIDLTVTNPTAVGLSAGDAWRASLADAAVASYEPDPRGRLSAREAVASWYGARGVAAAPERIVLAASSSEAYAWLFKLLAGPGDAVLVPAPSYPLLDALAGLEGVALEKYRLPPEDGYRLHAGLVDEAWSRVSSEGKRVAAVVVVNPNNPTGSSLSREELIRLLELGARHGFAVISDEVFLDYRFEPREGDVRVAARETAGLVFSLGGLSKSAALPQLKLSWILANGPAPVLDEALARLDWIADAFLSVGTPVQVALPALLAHGESAARFVRERILANLETLAKRFGPGAAARLLPVEGGWSAVLRVPAVEAEEALVLRLLSEHDVLVHPGYFFDFPHEAFLVFSLLPEPARFSEGVGRVARALGT
ncbi:MAG TPA: pyridoxal phosphate-dependent aminotransferase [Thermoanaerobaculia bacterium]|nr:pyridoxal phosphate-dependent aminotransferase [Thermoanaerobaculia bacterium]